MRKLGRIESAYLIAPISMATIDAHPLPSLVPEGVHAIAPLPQLPRLSVFRVRDPEMVGGMNERGVEERATLVRYCRAVLWCVHSLKLRVD